MRVHSVGVTEIWLLSTLRHSNPIVQLELLNLLMMATSLQPRLAHAQGKMLLTWRSHLLIFLWLCVLFCLLASLG